MKSSLTCLPQSLKEKESHRFERLLAKPFLAMMWKTSKSYINSRTNDWRRTVTASLSAAIFAARGNETGPLSKGPRDLRITWPSFEHRSENVAIFIESDSIVRTKFIFWSNIISKNV